MCLARVLLILMWEFCIAIHCALIGLGEISKMFSPDIETQCAASAKMLRPHSPWEHCRARGYETAIYSVHLDNVQSLAWLCLHESHQSFDYSLIQMAGRGSSGHETLLDRCFSLISGVWIIHCVLLLSVNALQIFSTEGRNFGTHLSTSGICFVCVSSIFANVWHHSMYQQYVVIPLIVLSPARQVTQK